MGLPPQPIYLPAGSRLLFRKEEGHGLLDSVRRRNGRRFPKAARVGASDGDDPAFHSIFEAALGGVGIGGRRMSPASLSPRGD